MEFPRKLLEKLGFIFIFLVVGLGLYFSRTNLPYFEGTFVREDSFVEWTSVLALFVGTLLCLYRVHILKPFRNNGFIWGLYFFAFLFFFGMGEEISWGQRIFEFNSPQFFLKYNSQMEFNFHNLRFGGFKINKYIFGTLLGIIIASYFLILPFAYQRIEKIKAFVNRFAIPVPRIYHIAAYLLLFLLVNAIPSGKKGEILEFGGCWIFLMMIFEPLNREVFSRKSLER